MGIIKRQKIYMKNIFLVFLFIVFIFSFRNTFDSKTYSFSALEIDRNITRQQYLGTGLEKIYKNRFGIAYFNNFYPKFQKFETNLFSNLGSSFIFVPFYVVIMYVGFKQNNEK